MSETIPEAIENIADYIKDVLNENAYVWRSDLRKLLAELERLTEENRQLRERLERALDPTWPAVETREGSGETEKPEPSDKSAQHSRTPSSVIHFAFLRFGKKKGPTVEGPDRG